MLSGVVANETEWFWAGRAAARVVGEGCVGNYIEIRAPRTTATVVEELVAA